MNVESQNLTANQTTAASHGRNFAALALPAVMRLALLAGPLTLAVVALRHSPVVCALVCLAVLALWLSVDVGPFRAGGAQVETRRMVLPSFRNLTKAQWWNGLFCRMFIVGAVVYSKLNV